MSEEAQASTQYGDLEGTIAIDGFDRLMFHTFPGAAKGYRPVGLEISYIAQKKGDEPRITISLLAVDSSTLRGTGTDAVRKMANKSGEVIVSRFKTELTLDRLLPHVQRMQIVLRDKSSNEKPLMVQDYED
jgi:hypothetical protein